MIKSGQLLLAASWIHSWCIYFRFLHIVYRRKYWQEEKDETADGIYSVLDSHRDGTYDVSAQSITGTDNHIPLSVVGI